MAGFEDDAFEAVYFAEVGEAGFDEEASDALAMEVARATIFRFQIVASKKDLPGLLKSNGRAVLSKRLLRGFEDADDAETIFAVGARGFVVADAFDEMGAFVLEGFGEIYSGNVEVAAADAELKFAKGVAALVDALVVNF